MRIDLILASLVLAVSCSAGKYEQSEPFDNVFLLAGNGTPYTYVKEEQSLPPKGYKPFYISHYGRHGSRIYESSSTVAPLVGILRNGQLEGNLNELGEDLLASMDSLEAAVGGIVGQITPRGARELKGIAYRMYHRFPRVFSGGGDVRCVASQFPRTIMSMANFTGELKGLSGKSEFHFFTGEKYQDILVPIPLNSGEVNRMHEVDVKEFYDSRCDRRGMIARFFRNAPQLDDSAAAACCKALFNAWYACGCADINTIDILKYWSEDELRAMKDGYANWYYVNHCMAADSSAPLRLSFALTSMRDFLQSMEGVATGEHARAADFRFGHDSGISPLMCLMGMEGYDKPYSVGEVQDNWDITGMLPMAANLQAVMYRKKGSQKILVKFLFNEREIGIPALTPVRGPYYVWDDVRSYWEGRVEKVLRNSPL